jgi:hypothetical protein
MYVNSKLVGVNVVSSTPVNVLDWYIGRYYHSNPSIIPFWLNADIDDIRIYNRALSASEVNGYCGTCNVSSMNDSIINNYAAVINYDSCNNSFIVDSTNGFKKGDTILMIQMKGADLCGMVSTKEPYVVPAVGKTLYKVAAIDLGMKNGILQQTILIEIMSIKKI